MLKSSLIFKRNGAHLIEKKTFKKNKDCPLSRFECFEHAKTFFNYAKFWACKKITINGKYSKKIMTIQTIMLLLWSFKHIKMQFKKVSIHLGGSFDYDFTQVFLWVYVYNYIIMALVCKLTNCVCLPLDFPPCLVGPYVLCPLLRLFCLYLEVLKSTRIYICEFTVINLTYIVVP
jgi:hypothetical protein